MNMEVFRQYLVWKDRKADLERELEETKERMNFFQDLIMDELVENGVDSVRVDGRNIFPKRQLFASPIALTDEFKALLRTEGVGDLITETVNGQRLSGFVREYMRDKEIHDVKDLPEWMKDNIAIAEKVTLGVRG